MDDAQRKAQIRKTFDTVAEGYGSAGMGFFHNAAAQLPRLFRLKGDEHLLDVATGTGIAAAALAAQLPRGGVTGIDFSEGMLSQARARAQKMGLGNIDLHTMDMQVIEFEDAQFDAANCSFGLFFVPDMSGLLKHIVSKVKQGGQVVTCSFYEGSFEPNLSLFLERIQRFGIEPPPFSWKRLCTEDHYHDLYADAGLQEVQTARYPVGYLLDQVDLWWNVIWYAGFRGLVAQLQPEQLIRFKREHLAEISALDNGDGIPLNITALFASGRVA
jgi:ubiquinone/menaquinone biosynthesis C-methylase UbiE